MTTPQAEKRVLRVAFTSNATAQHPPQSRAIGSATATQQPPLKPASLLDVARNRLRNTHATSTEKGTQHPRRNTTPAEAEELTKLLKAVLFDWEPADRAEALQIALGDVEDALICWRDLWRRMKTGQPHHYMKGKTS